MAPDADTLIALRQILGDIRPDRRQFVSTLFERERPVPRPELDAAFGVDQTRSLIDLGLVRSVHDRCEPLARIDRTGRLFIASDLRQRRWQADFVVGPGPASFLLARFIHARRRETALDLGCGSGILSLVLAARGASVLGLDINPRAVGYSRFNAAVNGRRDIVAELGDFLSQAADGQLDGRFDVVVANPPFVLAPARQLVYRDRPLPGDEVGRRTVERVVRALAAGGRGYLLTNWINRGEADWSAPVRRWIDPLGVDAFVVRVGDHSPEAYAAAWNRDVSDPDRGRVVAAWTNTLRAEGVARVHAGVIALGRALGPVKARPRFQAVLRDDQTVNRQTIEDFLGAR